MNIEINMKPRIKIDSYGVAHLVDAPRYGLSYWVSSEFANEWVIWHNLRKVNLI